MLLIANYKQTCFRLDTNYLLNQLLLTVGDFEDYGSEYLPSPTPSSCNDDSEEVQQSRTSSVTTLQLPLPSTSSSITAEAQISTSAADTTYKTPVLNSRKRVKRPETWRRNILKLKRAKGEQLRI